MERPQGVLSLARLLPSAARLVFRMMLQASALGRWRRQAIKGFRQGLEESGVPPAAAEELAAAYPDFNVRAAIAGRRSQEPRGTR
ncbi:MAG: hypothetical protein FJX75_04705 [Armatimonadetes bacterium]|nr:hypothetical protein [Armatimonadota bacterium]